MRRLMIVLVLASVGSSCAASAELVVTSGGTATEPSVETPRAERPTNDVAADDPTPVPTADQTGTDPSIAIDPTEPIDDGPVPPVDDPPVLGPNEADGAWTTHPLAVYVPDASEIGLDWINNTTSVTEYAAAEPNAELAACGLTEPPTLDGLEATYTAPGDDDYMVQFVVNRGSVADAQSFLDVFRGLVDCDSDVFGFSGFDLEITTETIAVASADDAVVMRFAGPTGDASLEVAYVVARYGELLFAMTSGGFPGEATIGKLSVDEMVGIVERAAQRG
jgi:hypothetical protein